MSRKNPSFSQAIRYVLSKRQDEKLCWRILHNIDCQPNDYKAIVETYKKNNAYRPKNKRSTVALYHEVLSFSNLDREVILNNPHIIEDLARRYLEKRTDGLGFAYPHYDTDHPHVHIILSSNVFESPKSIRISKQEFSGIKKELETYMVNAYPELTHSIIQKHLKVREVEITP